MKGASYKTLHPLPVMHTLTGRFEKVRGRRMNGEGVRECEGVWEGAVVTGCWEREVVSHQGEESRYC